MNIIRDMIEIPLTTMEKDGIILTNPREIGAEVAFELLDQDTIYDFDVANKIEDYLANIIYEATNRAIELIEENNRDVINTY